MKWSKESALPRKILVITKKKIAKKDLSEYV